MKYQCISCKEFWGDGDETELSHGLCKECLKKEMRNAVHKNQIKQGYTPCFDKIENCQQTDCKYYDICQ